MSRVSVRTTAARRRATELGECYPRLYYKITSKSKEGFYLTDVAAEK